MWSEMLFREGLSVLIQNGLIIIKNYQEEESGCFFFNNLDYKIYS